MTRKITKILNARRMINESCKVGVNQNIFLLIFNTAVFKEVNTKFIFLSSRRFRFKIFLEWKTYWISYGINL